MRSRSCQGTVLNERFSGSSAPPATAPNGWHPHALAPRVWYMLFPIDNDGVPSVGKFMHLH